MKTYNSFEMSSPYDLSDLLGLEDIYELKQRMLLCFAYLVVCMSTESTKRRDAVDKPDEVRTHTITNEQVRKRDQFFNDLFLSTAIGQDFAHKYHRQIIHSTDEAERLMHFLKAFNRVQHMTGIMLDPAMIEQSIFTTIDVRQAMCSWGIWADIYYGHDYRQGKIRKGGIMLLKAMIIFTSLIVNKLPEFDSLRDAYDVVTFGLFGLGHIYDRGQNMFNRNDLFKCLQSACYSI